MVEFCGWYFQKQKRSRSLSLYKQFSVNEKNVSVNGHCF
jgi:hypothetical protein